MAVISSKLKLPTTGTSSTKKNNNTSGLIVPVVAQPNLSYGSNTAIGSTGGLTPTKPTASTLVAKPNLSYSGNVSNLVGAMPANGSSGSTGGTTNEGVILGSGQKVNNSTFNNISSGTKSTVDTSYQGNISSWLNNAKTTVGSWLSKIGNAAQSFVQKLDTSYAQNSTPVAENAVMTAGQTPQKQLLSATVEPTYAENNADVAAASTQNTAETVDTTTATGAESSAPLSFEQWKANEEGNITKARDDTYAAIDTNKENTIAQAGIDRDTAVQTAETNRERAIVDARSDYEQNKATYGANAEALASMGLTGSGYGDYINAQAYATQRGEIQAAKAQAENATANAETTYDKAVLDAEAIANASKLEADTTYAANMSALGEKELAHNEKIADDEKAATEKKQGVFADLLYGANTGGYTAEQLATLGAQRGLSPEEITTLQNAANDYDTNVKGKADEEAKTKLFGDLLGYANSGVYTREQLAELGKDLTPEQIEMLGAAADKYANDKRDADFKALMSAYDEDGYNAIADALNGENNFTGDQKKQLLGIYQNYYYKSMVSDISSDYGSVDTKAIDDAADATKTNPPKLSSTQYADIKSRYVNSVKREITAGTIFKNSSGNLVSESEAKAIVEELKATGWLSDSEKTSLDNLVSSTYKKEEDDGGCVAKGTLVMTADGSQVAIESLKEGDNVLVFNHTEGDIGFAPISLIFHEGEKEHDVLRLHFDGGADIDVLYGHGFFDTDLKKYVLINADNVKEYIGHRFYHIVSADGAYVKKLVSLTDYEVFKKRTEAYSVLTSAHINSIANGILTVTDDGNRPANLLKGFYNLFELDDNYKYSAEEMAADIEKYGLAPYEDWKEYISEEQFAAFNGSYINIAIGKELVSRDEVVGYIKKFLHK